MDDEFGNFDSADPLERYNAHQRAKGRTPMADPDDVRKRERESGAGLVHYDTERGTIETIRHIDATVWYEIAAPDVMLSIEPRPHHCDRGRYVVKASPRSHKVTIDAPDAFPRYYFDWGRMLDEVAAWLAVRGQLVTYTYDQEAQAWTAA